jgi:CRISPR-associated endonuclease Cas1
MSATLLAQTFPRGNLNQILHHEGRAPAAYWAAFAATSIKFATRDHVRSHRQALGPRRSPITQSPQRAATPGHALLSYLYGIATSEIVIACHAAGLDPALGVLHVDRAARPSLAYDLIEPIRPAVDRWLLRFLSETTFNKRDFHEHHDGTISIARPMT